MQIDPCLPDGAGSEVAAVVVPDATGSNVATVVMSVNVKIYKTKSYRVYFY